MSRVSPDATYVQSGSGRLFVTFWCPAEVPRHCVLVVPAFAEEMNKSRRMLAEVANRLAQRGVAVVMPDLFGTGDSDGDFADAGWNVWLDDLRHAADWVQKELGPLEAMLAVRLGASLAAEACDDGFLPASRSVLLWQPVFDRRRHLAQVLRLRISALLAQEDRRESVDDLMRRLIAGESIEVAGYELPAAVGITLAQADGRSRLPAGWPLVHWMEIRRNGVPLAPASVALIDASIGAGQAVETWSTTGDPFWSATEVVCHSAWMDHTVELLS